MNRLKSFFKITALGFLGLTFMGSLNAAVSAPDLERTPLKEAAPTITSHRAMYLIKLAGTRNGSNVSDISGRMLFSWTDDCHAWNVEQKMQLRFFYSEGEISDTVSDLISREAKDGTSYNFHTRRTSDDNKEGPQTFRGFANLNGDGTGEAVYSGENGKRFNLSGTTFPAHHTLKLLEHARKGEKFFAVNVFDGADEKGFNEISSFISPAVEQKAIIEKAKATTKQPESEENDLLKAKAWPIRMAFFAPKNETGSPEYEMDMMLLDNGVIKSMTINYGDFSMTADLVDVKPIAASKCGSDKSIPPS